MRVCIAAAGARFYLSPDPLSEKRIWLSPYNYVQNSPLTRIDPTGMLDDNYIVDEEGKLKRIEKTDEKTHRLIEENKDGKRKEYQLNDPKNDSKKLKRNFSKAKEGTQIVEKWSKKDVKALMDKKNIEKKGLIGRNFFAGIQSMGGKLDFSLNDILPDHGIEPVMGERDVSALDDPGGFIVFEGNNTAFNYMDAGNFLWGNAMEKLGFSLFRSIEGAGKAAMLMNTFEGFENGFLDSGGDTKAIMQGFWYNKKPSIGSIFW